MKAAVPRQARNASTLRDALKEWRDNRLLPVAKSCENLNDSYRMQFGKYHKEYANRVSDIIDSECSDLQLYKYAQAWLTEFRECLEHENPRGALKDAAGLCGAELQKIINESQ